MDKPWFVYVIQSQLTRPGGKPGFYYVGATTDPLRRLRQHNGEIKGGGRFTSQHRPWKLKAVFGLYENRSEALKAEYALKHSKRGHSRVEWTPEDSPWCRGLGPNHPWIDQSIL